jgi:hypothetical protein
MAYHKPTTYIFSVKVPQTITCRVLAVDDMMGCASVLQEKETGVFSQQIYDFFQSGYLGFGAFEQAGRMVGYAFIKKPKERPETLVVIRKQWRGLGIANSLRDFAIKMAVEGKQLVGDYVYSMTEIHDTDSLGSLLNSDFEIVGISEDANKSFVQLRYKIRTPVLGPPKVI